MPADPGAPVRRVFIANALASAVLASAPVLAQTPRKTPRVGVLYLRSARPGGNVTGLTVTFPDLSLKRLEFLREFLPTSLGSLSCSGRTRCWRTGPA
jgi:hypothetical protein